MEIFIPDNTDKHAALARTTHLSIAAHQDDIEIMAYDGILKCYGGKDKWFTGVIVTNGSGSPRTGVYADYSDEQMMQVRKIEQKTAASIGKYSAQVFLDYPSGAVKKSGNREVIDELKTIIIQTKPEYIYTHNLADKHDTHIGVVLRVIEAVREVVKETAYKPKAVYGCEVWRGLDWLLDDDKICFDVSSRSNLENALLGVFDSQITGGKRYDLATAGRRLANATYSQSHEIDSAEAVSYAMDLTPLLDPNIDIADFIGAHINKLVTDVRNRIERVTH